MMLVAFISSTSFEPNKIDEWEYSIEEKVFLSARNSSNFTSNLSWGPSSGLNAFVAVGTPMTMSINITNGAVITDTVNFTILNEYQWSCVWYGTNQSCTSPMSIVVAPGQLAWPKFTIEVPEVVNGTPAAFVRHPFTLTAKSGLDGVELDYTFTLEPDELFQAEFDSESNDLSLDPAMKKRVTLVGHNTGNSPASLVARLVPVNEQGEMVGGYSPELSYQHEGWMVGLFDVHHLNGLGGGGVEADGTATFDVEVQPPSLTAGSEYIGVLLWSANNPYETDLVVINASILWHRDGDMHIDDGCDGGDVLPFQSCYVSISVSNLGNHQDTFELVVESDEWLEPSLSRSVTILEKGEEQQVATLTLTVDGLSPAFTHGGATIILRLGSGEELARASVVLRVAPLVDWELHAVENSTDSRDNISVAFTMKNLGNGDDGLQISLHVDMNVEHALIPPEGAIHGSVSGQPRYFEIERLDPGVNFTFRAWMHLPRDMDANGTVTMTVNMQSTLRPEMVFSSETSADFLAEKYRPESQPEEDFWLDLEIAMSNIWNQFNGLILTILVAVVGGLFLLKAVQHRQEKEREWKARVAAAEGGPPEQPDEWLAKFDKTSNRPPASAGDAGKQAPSIAGKVFQDLFKAKSRKVKKAPEVAPPDENLLSAANTVFTHHEKNIEGGRLDDLAGKLVEAKSKHPANTLLPEAECQHGRTVRRPKHAGSASNSDAATSHSNAFTTTHAHRDLGEESEQPNPSVEGTRRATDSGIGEGNGQGDEFDFDL